MPFWTVLPADVAALAITRLNDIVIVTQAEPFEEPGLGIVYVNAAFERVTGYKAEEVLGRSPRFLQGPNTSPQEIVRIEEALRARKPVRAELQNYRKDGSTFWVEFEASSVKIPQEDAEFFVFIERDVTERKQAEAALREHEQAIEGLFSNLPGMAYRCRDDDHWTKEFVSAGCTALTGYLPEDLVGNTVTNFEEIIHPDDRRGVRDTVADAASNSRSFELTYRIRTRDGAIKWVLDRGCSVQGPTESKIRIYEGFISDITERKLLESQVVQNQRLESVGTLAGGIAHDLNNILAPIMMAGDLLQEKVIDSEGSQLLGVVKANAKRGAELVRQILLFARGMEGPRVAVQPKTLLGEIRTFVEGTFPKSIHVAFEFGMGSGPILGDPTQLHQLLLNLCLNAKDAMPNGGRLVLSARPATVSPSTPRPHPDATPGNFVRIDVADTGSGIPDILKGQIFDPFFTTKGVGRGSGLGLSTARSIVKAHAGFITFVSREGFGTTFSVFLPAADMGTRAPKADSEGRGARHLIRGKGERILVVDDEDSVRQIIRTSLEHFGFQVTKAQGGVEALEIARNSPSPFALAIIDIQMPGMDGIETIGALRKLNPGLPVIASSGYASTENRDNAAAKGVVHFLEKPFTVDVLVGVVHAAIAKASA